ncbi:hypothetical protein QL285_010456 [Trifolium repens]|nr:hypothetical protein QL285_010456 [Trifolium repens]
MNKPKRSEQPRTEKKMTEHHKQRETNTTNLRQRNPPLATNQPPSKTTSQPPSSRNSATGEDDAENLEATLIAPPLATISTS